MKYSIPSFSYLTTAAFLTIAAPCSYAADIFDATTLNTTIFNNNVNNGSGAMTVTGATPDLLLANSHGNFNSGGFASTDDINTLNGTALTSLDTVTISLTVDSVTHTDSSQLRSRGIEFGMAANPEFDGGVSLEDNLIVRVGGGGNSGVSILVDSFATTSTAAFTIDPASVEDGFTVVLTADQAGFTFSFIDVTASSGTLADITGTFAPGDFTSFFGDGHLYFSAQKRLDGTTTLDISEANIDLVTVIDSDGDNIPDLYEDATPGLDRNNPADAAQGANDGLFDNDGRTNLEEYLDGTDPNIADVDGDNLNDGEEFTEGTNPLVADTDGDMLDDGQEVNGTLNPFQVGHVAGSSPGGVPGERTDPLLADSDNDSISDFDELNNANGSITNPNSIDTDGDTLFDNEEVDSGLDPNDAGGDNNATGDPDGDTLSNLDEILMGTSPILADTDGDGIDDDEEFDGIFNPFQAGHTPGDPPAGTPGAATNPLLADSDGDGLSDKVEVESANGSVTDPNNGDTDGDSFRDSVEIEVGSLPNDATSTPSFPAISWSVQEFDEEADLSTDGTLLFADNLDGDDITLNGIPFVGRLASSDPAGLSSPQLQTQLPSIASNLNLGGLYDNEVSALAPLLTTFWFGNSSVVNSDSFVISGLTPGQTYLVEFGQADDRSNANIINRYRVADSFGGGAEGDPLGATNLTYGGPDKPAILVTGTFTATHSIQVFLWGVYEDDDTLVGSQIPFIQVREIAVTSEIQVCEVRHTGSSVEIDFAGLDASKSYQLIRSADLQDGFPSTVDGPRNPVAASDTFTDPSPLAGKAFYQLEELPN